MVTDAIPKGLRSRVPAKITSSIRDPRRLFADCSPSTQLMASLRLDLPQPFGPTMAAIPPPLNFSAERSQKDLKPCSSTRLSFSKPLPRLLGGVVTILNSHPSKVKHYHHIRQVSIDLNPNISWSGYGSREGHLGGRFSRKARIPSWQSGVSKFSSRSDRQTRPACSQESPRIRRKEVNPLRSTAGLEAARAAATWRACACNSPRGTT